MARHRTDPRGGARIAIAAAAVLMMLALLGVGVYTLSSALDTRPTPGTTGAAPADASSPSQSPPPVLAIRVTGQQCQVFVSAPGNSDVLINRVLQHGESFVADQPRLDVVVSDAGAVDIRVNGVRRPPGTSGHQLSFTVTGGGTPAT
jgi:hypothetical protein